MHIVYSTTIVVVGMFYRPPNNDIQCFIDVVKDICDKLRNENKLCYLLGDYNINLLNVDTHTSTADFNDTMFSNGFIPLITRPTSVTQSTATLIDNIFTNQLAELHNNFYREYCWLIYPITILYFVWIKWSKKKLWQLLFPAGISVKEIKTNSCKQCLMLTGVITFWLYRKLIKIHALCFPLETISKRFNARKPWLSQVLRDSIKKKNKPYIKSIKH